MGHLTPFMTTELTAFDNYLYLGAEEDLPKVEGTRKDYCWTIQHFLMFLDGRHPTRELGEDFIKHLEEKSNKPSSIKRHISALKCYFRFKTMEFKIHGIKIDEYHPRILQDWEWRNLISTATAPIYDRSLPDAARNRARLELALLYSYCGGGLRCSEATHIKIEDLVDERYIRVLRSGRKEQLVPVEPVVIRAIRDYLATRWQDSCYVFCGKDPEKPMAIRTAQGIIKKLCTRAGLKDVNIRSLRHTAAHQFRKAGADERDVRDFLGSESTQRTKITHISPEALRQRLPTRFDETEGEK